MGRPLFLSQKGMSRKQELAISDYYNTKKTVAIISATEFVTERFICHQTVYIYEQLQKE